VVAFDTMGSEGNYRRSPSGGNALSAGPCGPWPVNISPPSDLPQGPDGVIGGVAKELVLANLDEAAPLLAAGCCVQRLVCWRAGNFLGNREAIKRHKCDVSATGPRVRPS